jgi:hypothetical protein
MFTSPKVYDLNVQTEARRKQQMEFVKKRIQQTASFPTIVEPSKKFSTFPNQGTPAYAMSLKQRQQAMLYRKEEVPVDSLTEAIEDGSDN